MKTKKTLITIKPPEGEAKEYLVDSAIIGMINSLSEEISSGETVAVGYLSPLTTSILKNSVVPKLSLMLDEHMQQFSPIELLMSLGDLLGGKKKKEKDPNVQVMSVDTSGLEKLLGDLFK